MRKIVAILLTAVLSLSCFSAFACGGRKTYSITYSVADGTLPDGAISEYSESDKDISLPTPTKAGYTFAGWKNGSDVITVIAAGTKGDLYLTATWQANSYTITFDYGEGSGTETSRDVTYGSAVTYLPIATPPTGKTFTAWKMENGSVFANGTAYNFENDITLTAYYTTDEYVITYRLDGGDPLPADAITAYSISAQDIPLPTTTKTGHTFTGWNSGTGIITVIAAGTTGNLDLTATWQANSYTITFNYGEGSGTETSRDVEYGSSVTDLPIANAPTGKTFTAWKMENGSVFANGTAYNFENDITLTASYTTDEYGITYHLDGGDPLSADAITAYSISDENIPLPTPTKTGHTFTGWNNGTEVITVIAAGTIGNLDLTATWQVNSYTVTFDYGEGSGTEASCNVEYGSTVENLPEATPPTGKTFVGWKDESNNVFANGTAYDFDRNITLAANYRTNEYTVAYNVAGGNPLSADAITKYSISAQDIPLPTTTKTGHTFTGWNNGTEIITVIAAGTVGNLDLTATWQANSYTITFNYGEGTGTETSRNVTYGSSVTDLPIATPPNAEKPFFVWKKEDGSVFNNSDKYLFDRDVTLTAHFAEAQFTVTLNNTTAAGFTAWSDDSTGSKAVLVNVGDKLIIPAIKWDDFSETRKEAENYNFLGWFYRDKDNAERQFDPNAAFTLENLNLNAYNVTLYAKVMRQWTDRY